MKLIARSCFLIVLISQCLLKVCGDDCYTAAVVEYYRTVVTDDYSQRKVHAEETLNRNTEYYLNILKDVQAELSQNSKSPLDIIIYPESTLYTGFTNLDYLPFGTLVPAAADKIAPCDDPITYKKFLVDLSLAARTSTSYMVVNVVEKEPCTEQQANSNTCSAHGFNLYNTNVAFDRQGTVVAKYRKYNLFKEPLNQTDYAEKVTFETDFGVTFGTFTCFDIMFPNPALELVQMGIKHFIFPSMWFSELPFLVSVQAQEMWSRENDVVLLASGALNPDNGSGGTGIYQGSYGALNNIITAEKGNQHYIIEQVPKVWAPKPQTSALNESKLSTPISRDDVVSLDNFALLWDNITAYTSQLVDTKLEEHRHIVCSTASGYKDGELPGGEPSQFCCEFNLQTDYIKNPRMSTMDFYHYRVFAYSGVRSFTGAYNGGLEVCGLVACTDPELQTSCGKRFPDAANIHWPLTFSQIDVQANFTKSPKRAQFPNSLRWDLKAVPAMETDWESVDYGTQTLRTHKSRIEQKELLSFGIYGRDFARDSDPSGAAGLAREYVTLVVIFVVVMLSMVFNFHSMY